MARPFTYDLQTTNVSFIQTAKDLRDLGIKNYMFFLKLYDRNLVGVDPHSDNLTHEQQMRILTECTVNPWYFLRECVRLVDQGNPKAVSYKLNRANLAMTWCIINDIDNYTVIPRQIGKTQSAIAILDWAFLFGMSDSEMMFLNMDESKAKENLDRLKQQRDRLPKYMQFKVAYDDEDNEIKGSDNVKSLSNPNNGNKVVIKASARTKDSAQRIGRGSTQPVQLYDEFEFTDFNSEIFKAAGPAYVTASKNAERNKSLHSRIFISTPGDLDSRAGKGALEIINETYKWSEKFYDMPINEVKECLATNSKNGIVYIQYNYKQLGKDEDWFREICKAVNGDPIAIKREILLGRIHGSTLSPFQQEDLDAIDSARGKVIEEIFINKIFKLDIYSELNKNSCYFVGVDAATGTGGDNSAVTIMNPYTLDVVAEFKSPYIGIKDYIKFLYVLVKRYVPRAILIIERNSVGEAILDQLRSTDIRANIYFDRGKDFTGDIDEKLDVKGRLKQEAMRRKTYGVYTGPKSRQQMFNLLHTHVADYKEKFIGNNLIDDIMGLISKNGRVKAGPDSHDDSVMSYLMCLYVYYYGNNLHMFGFARGVEVSEAERNKGMVAEDIMSYLSETDRAFFEGVDFSDSRAIENLDMRQAIQNARGLVTDAEIRSAVGERETKLEDNPLARYDRYDVEQYIDMVNAKKESDSFNRMKGLDYGYEVMSDSGNESDEDDFDASFFAMLNE